MKFRRYMSAIYSSALVLGLTFLLYPQAKTTSTKEKEPFPTTTPAVTSAPLLSGLTDIPDVSPLPTESVTLTPTEAPQKIHPLFTDTLSDPLPGITELVTSYINSYYKNDLEALASLVTEPSMLSPALIQANSSGVTKVTDLKLYSKPGIDGIFSVVYATYSLSYDNTSPSIPRFSEYYIKRVGNGVFLINTAPLSTETKAALAQARTTESVLNMAISTLIRCYNNACLTLDEQRLEQCVTNPDYLNLEYFASRFSYTEYFSDYNFLFYPGINEFDYIVYVTYKEKIVLIDTPAPCMECYYVYLDPATGNPYIYLGITSLDTDAYCAAVTQSEPIQALAKETNQAMTEALLADDDLKDFYNRLVSASTP
ncbi:MAG: hypothetical protein J1E35_08180 [Lachnospiraceae bacterium]|nr:hypothetical protein [Lachnospiraceae bacterium]